MKKCPYCHEDIRDEAVKCRYCGEWLKEEAKTQADSLDDRVPSKKRSSSLRPIFWIGGTILLMFLAFLVLREDINTTDVETDRTVEISEEKRAEFEQNIEEHYQKLVDFIADKNFQAAKSQLHMFRTFRGLDYKDVAALNNKLSELILYEKVRQIPASNIHENAAMYKRLVELNPGNEMYKSKYQHYESKLKRPERAQSKAPDTQRRIKRQFSAWDGSHRNLERHIKRIMNDPDSYDHVETVYWDMGDHLVVRTTFRGKNAFGGVVTNTVKAKVDLDGNVIEVEGPY